MIREGMLLDINSVEIHIGDYGILPDFQPIYE